MPGEDIRQMHYFIDHFPTRWTACYLAPWQILQIIANSYCLSLSASISSTTGLERSSWLLNIWNIFPQCKPCATSFVIQPAATRASVRGNVLTLCESKSSKTFLAKRVSAVYWFFGTLFYPWIIMNESTMLELTVSPKQLPINAWWPNWR